MDTVFVGKERADNRRFLQTSGTTRLSRSPARRAPTGRRGRSRTRSASSGGGCSRRACASKSYEELNAWPLDRCIAWLKAQPHPEVRDRTVWEMFEAERTGLIVCGQCRGRYTKRSASLFGCAAARNKGATVCANLMNVRRDRLEAMVLDALRNQLMEPELFKEFCTEFTRVLNDELGNEAARREQLADQLQRVERRIRRIVDAIAEGAPARALTAELLALEEQQERLEAELAAAPEAQPQPTRLHPNMAEIYRRKVAALHAVLEDEAVKDEAFELIRSLIEKVVVTPVDGELRIDLQGELAGILNLCRAGRDGARPDAALVSQIKVVAGAGFEPATFRL